MDFDQLVSRHAARFSADGPHSDIVLFSRVRLARNINGYPFAGQMSDQDRRALVGLIRRAAENLFPLDTTVWLDLQKAGATDRDCLVERRLIDGAFAEETSPRAILIDGDELFTIAALEEDHLRVNAFASGLDFPAAWERASRIVSHFENEFVFAFDQRRGYLTACPSNTGTGLRAAAVLHLPGLIATGEFNHFSQSMQQMNFTVHSIYGKGTHSPGALFQVCNQIALGPSEEEILASLEGMLPRVLQYEERARENLLKTRGGQLSAQVDQAMSHLETSRRITIDEALADLSVLRLGYCLGLQKEVSVKRVNDLIFRIQPAHLQKIADHELSEDEDETFRADYLHHRLP
ncbi:MAG: ATP--guanido phosphotransferase [Thermoguttaceae bacterium]|nr:ATP--guanido phosphotransferase [Thermoguttaceae bacterium]